MLTSCPYLPYYSLYTPIYTYPPLGYPPYHGIDTLGDGGVWVGYQ